MAIQFPHATRSLRDDRLVPTIVIAAVVSLLLVVWGAWLALARVPVTESCAIVGASADGGLDARCPMASLARIPLGARAVVVPPSGSVGQGAPAIVYRLPSRFERELPPDTLRLMSDDGRPLEQLGGEVRITVAEVSPLALIAGRDTTQAAP